MQPYFMPYLGYFQLIAAANVFVILDDVQYIQRGWINRNRVLNQGRSQYITIPLLKASQNKRINELAISHQQPWQKKMLHTLRAAYGRAPGFDEVFPLCETIIQRPDARLVDFLEHALGVLCRALGIVAPRMRASQLAVQYPELACDSELRGADRILAICRHLGATDYINPIGGTELYSSGDFLNQGIRLGFLKSAPPVYDQHQAAHVPSLSIIDVLMFNGIARTRQLLSCYELRGAPMTAAAPHQPLPQVSDS